MTLLATGALFATAMVAQVPLGRGETLILVGPPGSGKTLQAGKLSKKYKIPAISLADVLTQAMGKSSKLPRGLREGAVSGELLDDQNAIEMIGARIAKTDASKGFILDGFPATEAQAKHLEAFIARQQLQPPIVVVLNAPDAVIRERLSKRGRADDTPQNIDRRLRDYYREKTFLENWYTTQNTVAVDSTTSPDDVFRRVEAGLQSIYDRRKLKTRP